MRKETFEKKKCKKVKIIETEEAELKEEGTEDVKNEVEDLMKDHEKFANIQKLLSEGNEIDFRAQSNKRIQEMQDLANSIFNMHCQGQ